MFDLAIESPAVSIRLYQLMKDVDMVLRHHNIDYWIDGGTLIGAIRHQGIIPYDDDLDIQIDQKDVQRLQPALDDLEKIGYTISDDRSEMIQVYKYDKVNTLANHLDIFVMKFDGDKSIYTHKRSFLAWGNKRTPHKSEIFPLKEYKFGEFSVKGANNPFPYLKEHYSKDIMTHGCIYPKHGDSVIKKGRCLKLEGKMFEPLKPTGPLIDNSHIYQN